ncbi:MAG: phosphate/phosphite/phosphonate ABC transporter substrate-binding protein [Hyphomicrobiales bacterium]
MQVAVSKSWRRVAGGMLSALAVLAFSGTWAKAAECQNPDSLTFAIIPTEETVAELTLYKPITDRLAKTTGKKIQFFMPTSYASVVEGLLGKFVDVAVLGPSSYVTAHKKDPTVEVFATYAKRPGVFQEEGPGYKAVLVSKAGSKFKDIASLKGALVGLVEPGSTSGELLPRVGFRKEIDGVDIDKYFGKTVYTGSHELSAVAVVQGKVDAAFVATHRLDNAIAKGDVKKEDFQIIWESKPVPQDPFVYRGALCPELKAKIAETFLGLSASDPGEKKFLDNVKSNKFVPMKSEDYDLIRELQAAKEANKKKS